MITAIIVGAARDRKRGAFMYAMGMSNRTSHDVKEALLACYETNDIKMAEYIYSRFQIPKAITNVIDIEINAIIRNQFQFVHKTARCARMFCETFYVNKQKYEHTLKACAWIGHVDIIDRIYDSFKNTGTESEAVLKELYAPVSYTHLTLPTIYSV